MKFEEAMNDDLDLIEPEEASFKERYRCPVCHEKILQLVNMSKQSRPNYFRTIRNRSHKDECDKKPYNLKVEDMVIEDESAKIKHPQIDREKLIGYKVKSEKNGYYQEPKMPLILSIKNHLLNPSVKNIIVDDEAYNKLDFVDRFFLSYLNYKEDVPESNQFYFVGHVTDDVNDFSISISKLHYKGEYPAPFFKLKPKSGLTAGTAVFGYVKLNDFDDLDDIYDLREFKWTYTKINDQEFESLYNLIDRKE